MKAASQRAFLLLLPLALAALLALASAAADGGPRVLAIELDNDINPVTADFVVHELNRAEREEYDAVAILLDTPGGLVTSMEKIYKRELALRIPVIVYVSPQGADATSAGAFIAQAADVLAMAPSTTIGSSTPIAGGQDLPKDLRRKAIEKYASTLRGMAREHGRNGTWADAAVRRAANVTATEAVAQNIADELAPSLPALLETIDGRTTKRKGLTLDTAGARVETVEMSFWKRVLDVLIDGNVVALMFSIGLIGIVVELWHPGLIFPGTVGGISLIMGLYGVSVLPVSAAGVLLMLLAAAFFAAEPFITSHGALSLAGAVCFVLGALLLFDPAGPAYEVSLPVALAIAGTLFAFTAFAMTKVALIRRKPVEVGIHGMVGARAQVRRDGYVFAQGELWRARSQEPLEPGQEVEVTAVDGLVLDVRPL